MVIDYSKWENISDSDQEDDFKFVILNSLNTIGSVLEALNSFGPNGSDDFYTLNDSGLPPMFFFLLLDSKNAVLSICSCSITNGLQMKLDRSYTPSEFRKRGYSTMLFKKISTWFQPIYMRSLKSLTLGHLHAVVRKDLIALRKKAGFVLAVSSKSYSKDEYPADFEGCVDMVPKYALDTVYSGCKVDDRLEIPIKKDLVELMKHGANLRYISFGGNRYSMSGN